MVDYEGFLTAVQDVAQEDREHAEQAAGATLEALADVLPPDADERLREQLPRSSPSG